LGEFWGRGFDQKVLRADLGSLEGGREEKDEAHRDVVSRPP
jgi:hypothetical protein